MNVYQRVHAVLAEFPALGKDARAPAAMGGYAYRGIEAISAALKPLLAKHGLFFTPETLERRDEARQTSKGGVLYVVDVLVRFNFYDADGASVSASVWGQGSDTGDKAVSKAYTSALKSMLSPTFCISDAESDTEAHVVEETTSSQGVGAVSAATAPTPASPDEVARVRALAEVAGIGDWITDQGFSWPWTPEACAAIEAKVQSVPLAEKVATLRDKASV